MGRVLTKETIALGKQPYTDKIQLRGKNAAISTAAETIWTPGATYTQLTSAVAMEAVSSSANDTSAGTGARTISVSGVDSNYNIKTETVTLAGATPVALADTYIAINSVSILTAGSGLTNAGNIDIRTVSGSVIKNQIPSTQGQLGQSASFIYTIPKGYIGLLSDILISTSDTSGDVSVYLQTKDSNGIIKGEGETLLDYALLSSKAILFLGTGLLIPEKTLIELRCIADTGAGTLIANAELLLFDKVNNGIF